MCCHLSTFSKSTYCTLLAKKKGQSFHPVSNWFHCYWETNNPSARDAFNSPALVKQVNMVHISITQLKEYMAYGLFSLQGSFQIHTWKKSHQWIWTDIAHSFRNLKLKQYPRKMPFIDSNMNFKERNRVFSIRGQ